MNKLSVYLAVGLFSAAMDVGTMYGLTLLGFHYGIGAIIGFLAGLIINFVLHAHFTFGAKLGMVSFLRYITVVFFNLGITLVIIRLFSEYHSSALLGKLASLPLVTGIGYLSGKIWIFKPSN